MNLFGYEVTQSSVALVLSIIGITISVVQVASFTRLKFQPSLKIQGSRVEPFMLGQLSRMLEDGYRLARTTGNPYAPTFVPNIGFRVVVIRYGARALPIESIDLIDHQGRVIDSTAKQSSQTLEAQVRTNLERLFWLDTVESHFDRYETPKSKRHLRIRIVTGTGRKLGMFRRISAKKYGEISQLNLHFKAINRDLL